MTYLPVRSTLSAPAGARNPAIGPTQLTRPASTTSAAAPTGAAPVPSISVKFLNTFAAAWAQLSITPARHKTASTLRTILMPSPSKLDAETGRNETPDGIAYEPIEPVRAGRGATRCQNAPGSA